MTPILDVLAWALFAAVVFKVLFGYLAFLFGDEADSEVRVKLAALVESFSDRKNLGQVFANYLTQVVGRIDEHRRAKGRRATRRFFAMTFVASFAIVAFASHFASHQDDRRGLIQLATNYPVHTLAALFGMALFSAGFNLVSAAVTLRIFRFAGRKKTLVPQIGHLLAHVILIAIGTLFGLAIFMLLIFAFSESIDSFTKYSRETLEQSKPVDTFLMLLIGATCCLSSVVAVAGVLLVFSLSLLPSPLRRFIHRNLDQTQKSDHHVLKNLGNFFAGVAALVAAVLKLLN